jgi:hypothetical protein
MEPVPVAEKLLKTKLFGFSVQRLIQAFAVPMAPGLILTVLNFPAIIFGPIVILGAVIGISVYIRTPSGQNPAAWLIGMIKFKHGPDSFYWKPVQFDDDPVEIQTGEMNSITDENPAETQTNESMVGNENTIENLDFEAIHDDGVIETDEAYSLIIEIEARPWLILDKQSRQAVYQSFSQFLMGIKSPIQIFTLPIPYDADDYTESLKESNNHKIDTESKLLEYGRIQHAQWLENVVEMGDIRDRRHFIMVTAQKHKQNEQDASDNFLDRINPTSDDVDQEKRYDELWSRAQSVTSALPRTGVSTDIVNEREDTLKILYYYYKGRRPPENFNHGLLTKAPSESDMEDIDTQSVL